MINNNELSIAYVEVLTILKKLSKVDYNKIPKERIELFETYKDKDYIFNYNEFMPIESQISNKAKVILANIFTKYIAKEDEKANIYAKYKQSFIEDEKRKTEMKLRPLFKKEDNEDAEENPQKEIIKIEKENIFHKIIFKIKNILWRQKYER